jgi:WD40 repeat protein
VRSIWWEADDSRLVTAGMDGAVYEWRLSDLRRDKEAVLKGCAYTAVVASPDGKTLVATGSDRKLKELEDVAGEGRACLGWISGGGGLVGAVWWS